MYRFEALSQLAAARLVAIIREPSLERAREVAEAVIEGGIGAVEITFTTPGAADLIKELSSEDDGLLVGAGTVLDAETARLATLSGARFLISPHFRLEVLRCGHRYGVPVIPGAGTIDEVIAALEHGADAVKLFPSGVMGLDWFKALRSVVPQVPCVPTGFITPEEAPRWLEAGAVAVGVGSQLTLGGRQEIVARTQELCRISKAAGN